MALDQNPIGNDVLRKTESPSDENILAGLEALLDIYSTFVDTRERISDQGLGVVNPEESFFAEERTVHIGNFTLRISNLSQLENNIAKYKQKLDPEPKAKPFVGFVKNVDDLPEGPIAI